MAPLGRAYVAALGLVVILGLQAAASAAPAVAANAPGGHEPTIHLKLIGTSYTPVYTDGAQWAVYEPTEGVTRIMNTIKGTSTTRPDPAGCAGGLIAVGGGEILYRCSNPECPGEADSCVLESANEPGEHEYKSARYVVEDIKTGSQQPVAGESDLPTDSLGSGGGAGLLEAIGSEWAKGIAETNAGASFFFVNWHTGAVVREEEEPSSANEDIENLNSIQLLQPLCKPLTRQSESPLQAQKFAPTAYASPFALIGLNRYTSVPLQLRRCGSHARILLPGGGSAQLGAGVVSWGRNHVTRLRAHGHTWHGRFYRLNGAAGSTSSNSLLQHTSTMAFITVVTGESRLSQIYAAPIP